MIGAKATAAAFGEEVGWHAIDWTKANRVVIVSPIIIYTMQ